MKTPLIEEFYLPKRGNAKSLFEGCRVRLVNDSDFQAADTPQMRYREDAEPEWVYFPEATSLCKWLAMKTGQDEETLRNFVENFVTYRDE